MQPMRTMLSNHAELSRIADLPPIVTAVLVGCATTVPPGTDPDWQTGVAVLITAVAVSLLHMGGWALRQALAAETDFTEHPERPIPSGRLSAGAALRFAVIVMITGSGVLAFLSFRALIFGELLVAGLVMHAVARRRLVVSAAAIGACRGLVCVIAAAACSETMHWPIVVWFAVAMACTVTLRTLAAPPATSHHASLRDRLLVGILIIAAVPIIAIQPDNWLIAGLLGALAVGWTVQAGIHTLAEPNRARRIAADLAGLCLIDAFYLALLDQPMAGYLAVAGALITTKAHHRFPAT
ncbi:MAG: UbiA family prenyltransferase [Phycisphaerales bacterium]|nr:UbiA family prenyltransferase [Phycisphaerales bacterium]